MSTNDFRMAKQAEGREEVAQTGGLDGMDSGMARALAADTVQENGQGEHLVSGQIMRTES